MRLRGDDEWFGLRYWTFRLMAVKARGHLNTLEPFLALRGWPRQATSFLLGAVAVLAMPPFGLWPLWFLTFPGLVLLLDAAATEATKWRRAAVSGTIGWSFGFGYLLFGLYWIGGAFLVQADRFALLLPFAITLLPAFLACYFGLATAAAALVWRPGPVRLLTLAVGLGATEWLRGHWFTGFPWNAIGYGLTLNDALAQTASLVGVTGLTVWAVLLFTAPVLLLTGRGDRRRWLWPGCALALLATAFAWGQWQLARPDAPAAKTVRLRLVQPNTPEKEKFEAASARRIFDRILDLSRRTPSGAIDDLANTDVVIWPEEPLNFRLLQTPQALLEISALLAGHSRLLTGTIRADIDPMTQAMRQPARYFNSLAIIDSSGTPGAIFDKRHLVPFGEYLPFEGLLNRIGIENLTRTAGGMAEGVNDRVLVAPGLPNVSPLICYEAIFPEDAVSASGRPDWLLNITNDAWFGEQTGPYQHFHQARLRAIEQGLPLVRVAITGISAIVDGHGRVLQSLPLLTAGVIDGVLPLPLPSTLYGRFGDGMLMAELAIALGLLTIILTQRSANVKIS